MTLALFHRGQPAGAWLFERPLNGPMRVKGAQGRVLFWAQANPDGYVAVTDGSGTQVAWK